MYKNIKKDKINRKLVKEYEKKTIFLKYIVNNLLFSYSIREKAYLELRTLRKGVPTQINSRCILTGRGRAILSMYKISRITFKKLASNGLLKGIKKSSW